MLYAFENGSLTRLADTSSSKSHNIIYVSLILQCCDDHLPRLREPYFPSIANGPSKLLFIVAHKSVKPHLHGSPFRYQQMYVYSSYLMAHTYSYILSNQSRQVVYAISLLTRYVAFHWHSFSNITTKSNIYFPSSLL